MHVHITSACVFACTGEASWVPMYACIWAGLREYMHVLYACAYKL